MTARPVLLIDDDAGWCEEVCRFLEPRGYQVIAVATQAAALQVLAADHHSAPLAIFVEPALTDRHFCQRLREVAKLDDVSIFLVSAAPANAVYQRGAGASGYVRKTVALEHLLLLLGCTRRDFDGDASERRAA